MKDESFRPNRMLSYFQEEWKILFFVTVSGLIYNLGLLAGPWFEGKMTGKLVDLLGGTGTFHQMLMLVTAYVVSIGIVQVSRYFKRFYVRRFANNVNRHMKQILYGTLVRKSRLELEAEGTGNILTKAILDVDDCVEGMRKFTTEIFDTGVALLAYACMLLWYDWRLALLCMIFPPISYVIAEKMKVMVQKTGAAYKVQSGALSAATLDRATNAITYRVFGCEEDRKAAYEENLSAYESAAVRANIWNTAMPPIYRMISMTSILFILYFGGRNVLQEGWTPWNIAVFTTFCPATQSLPPNHRALRSFLMRYIKRRFPGNESNLCCRIPKQNRSFQPQRLQSLTSITCILPIQTEKRSSMTCRFKRLLARSSV